MSIKNRNVLDECKLLTLVKRWSEVDESSGDIALPDGQEPCDHAWLGKLVHDLADEAVTKSASSAQESELQAALRNLNERAKELFTEWTNLKVS